MQVEKELDYAKRYESDVVRRQYLLAQFLIHIRSYEWQKVDKVAEELELKDILSFGKVVEALNK